MGIVGFGSIGQACARLGRAYGMSIAALRRRTELSAEEEQSGLKVWHIVCISYAACLLDYAKVASLSGCQDKIQACQLKSTESCLCRCTSQMS